MQNLERGGGANKVHYGRCPSGELTLKYSLQALEEISLEDHQLELETKKSELNAAERKISQDSKKQEGN